MVLPGSPSVNNRGDANYRDTIAEIARLAHAWSGPIVIVAHVDPDGDALGSTLALRRALDALGKQVLLPMEPPRYLAFLAEDGELSPALPELPTGTLLIVLDVADRDRVWGAPVHGAERVVNIDHHGTNDRFGDLVVVEPGKAATALLIKELIEALGVAWTPAIATPCLTGILTDTGNFRYANTDHEVLDAAGDLIDQGVAYAELTDRLQWRHPNYFQTLGRVMQTVRFALDGQLVMADYTADMRTDAEAADDDSDDFVGIIRYAEGAKVAVLLKERGETVKVSVRTRDGASAQAICIELGGGGHVAAAGATIQGDLRMAEQAVLGATERELQRLNA
ncbi:MAG: DHH family phosphoesterase [Trueperaceae bacterium]